MQEIIIAIESAIKNDDFAAMLEIISLPDYDINRCYNGNYTALSIAVENQKPEFVSVFLQMGANPNFQIKGEVPLTVRAMSDGNDAIVTLLLEDPRTRDPKDLCGQYILHRAASCGNRNWVDLALARGSDPAVKNMFGNMPSEVANKCGHPELCQYLRQKAMSLQRCIQEKFKEDLHFIGFFKGKSPSEISGLENLAAPYALHGFYLADDVLEAAQKADVKKVEQLLSSGGIYVDQRSTDLSACASWYACQSGSLDIVKMLYACGASMTGKTIHKKNGQYLTAIDAARVNGHEEIAIYLESLKAQQIQILADFIQEKQLSTTNDLTR